MKTAKGVIIISAEVTCPYCNSENELTTQWTSLFQNNLLPNPATFKSNEYQCEHCMETFLVNEIEY